MKNVWTNNFILLVTAIVISLLLHVAHVLLPFMFGPIIASIIVIKVFKLEVKMAILALSQIGLILLGVQIGSTFTSEVLHDIKNDWLIIVVITLLLLVLSLLIAFFSKK